MKNVNNLSNKFSNLLKISALYSTLILSVACTQKDKFPVNISETDQRVSSLDLGLTKIQDGIKLNSLKGYAVSLLNNKLQINGQTILIKQAGTVTDFEADSNTSEISLVFKDDRRIEIQIFDKNKDVWTVYLLKEDSHSNVYLPNAIIDKTAKNFSFDSKGNIMLDNKYLLRENYEYIRADRNTFILTITESTLGFIFDFKNHDSTTERYLLKLNKDGTYKVVSIG